MVVTICSTCEEYKDQASGLQEEYFARASEFGKARRALSLLLASVLSEHADPACRGNLNRFFRQLDAEMSQTERE